MMDESQRTIIQTFALGAIGAYRKVVSPWLRQACRFVPTCSEYAGDAIETYGVGVGVVKALSRVLRCHPFNPGGIDPVD
jgi:putative membrane protein insertion efficiency factor